MHAVQRTLVVSLTHLSFSLWHWACCCTSNIILSEILWGCIDIRGQVSYYYSCTGSGVQLEQVRGCEGRISISSLFQRPTTAAGIRIILIRSQINVQLYSRGDTYQVMFIGGVFVVKITNIEADTHIHMKYTVFWDTQWLTSILLSDGKNFSRKFFYQTMSLLVTW